MTERPKAEVRALAAIATMEDPERLRTIMANAKARAAPDVERAAFLRLCHVQPSADPGTMEHDVWRSIHALEEMLRAERGRTTLLSRTRQKIKRDGEAKACADLTLKATPSDGFAMLVDRGHPDLLFEAVVLRHPERFTSEVADAARTRLAGIEAAPES
ncbi:hypothetical protein SAMN05444336_102325 [Albimonas donghaensis]|uniref:Uncharacterized protein n=1 Tax=Albimonas donghaensis TaxID=356660 RepID=A0A1H2WB58_9RHOB|nr:hypothetical protein [Albimonas donghaensis]SDW77923.1 hypothetical protein SAMN05444336_102325 [Albimonas donghaensis]